MSNPVDSTRNIYEAQIRATKDLADAFLSSFQRIDRVAVETLKQTVNWQLEFALAAATVRDLQGAETIRDKFEHPAGENAMAFYREVFDAVSGSLLASTRVFDRYVQDLGRSAAFDLAEDVGADEDSPAFPGPAALADLWNTGWAQWNSMAEQWSKAVGADDKQTALPEGKSRSTSRARSHALHH